MNPLLEVNRPTAENMKREEALKPGHRFTVRKTEQGFLSVMYKNIYPFAGAPSAIQVFMAVIKDISPAVVEVHTTGPKSLTMVERYTITDANTVEKTIVISNYGRAKQKDLDYGLLWNKTVWEKGLKGTV